MRLSGDPAKVEECQVSIHAPVKDATEAVNWYCDNYYVSIHAPVKDATVIRKIYEYEPVVSIHAPVKDATFIADENGEYSAVSIHAPVKDATRYLVLQLLHIVCFNPRTRKGCDIHRG